MKSLLVILSAITLIVPIALVVQKTEELKSEQQLERQEIISHRGSGRKDNPEQRS